MEKIFAVCVSIVILGWLWFYVARPILEDFGLIVDDDEVESVNHSRDVMSRSEPGSVRGRTGSGTGSGQVVPGQQHQAEPAAPANFDDMLDYLTRHKLETPEQVIDVLSVLQFGEGHLLSANKIRDLVGGNEAAVKARVSAHRPKAEAPRPSSRLERPENGWG